MSPWAPSQWMPGVGWVTRSRRLLPSRAPSLLWEPACLLVCVQALLARELTEKANFWGIYEALMMKPQI